MTRPARSTAPRHRTAATSCWVSSTPARARLTCAASPIAIRRFPMSEIRVPPAWSYTSVGDKIADIVLTRPLHWGWLAAFGVTATGTLVFFGAIAYLFTKGIGIWGVNIPTAWGFAIANFVWWIGIGHAGTFISAMLLLARQKWRTSINRFAEAMTLFAVACAGIFPIL